MALVLLRLIWDILSGVWGDFIDLLTIFIGIPIKIFEYLVEFGEYMLSFLTIFFYVIHFIVANIWIVVVLFIGFNCVKSYFTHVNRPHERLILFFQNCAHSFIWLSNSMFKTFKYLYEISLKIISSIIEHIPVIQ